MLYTVWTNYGAAEQNVDLEATSLRNIYRLAEGLPEPQHAQIQVLCRSYAKIVIEQDWPLMAQDQVPNRKPRDQQHHVEDPDVRQNRDTNPDHRR